MNRSVEPVKKVHQMKYALPLLLLTASPALAHPGPAGHVHAHDLPVLWAILALTGLLFGATLALALRKRPTEVKVKA